MTDESKLTSFRHQIAILDSELIQLLALRFKITGQIGELKRQNEMAVKDPEREALLHAFYAEKEEQLKLPKDCLKNIFESVISESRKQQEA
jgi:chorismate mutase